MSEETLFTAARRVVRFVRIDNEKDGGLLSISTTQAVETLEREVAKESEKQKAVEKGKAP